MSTLSGLHRRAKIEPSLVVILRSMGGIAKKNGTDILLISFIFPVHCALFVSAIGKNADNKADQQEISL